MADEEGRRGGLRHSSEVASRATRPTSGPSEQPPPPWLGVCAQSWVGRVLLQIRAQVTSRPPAGQVSTPHHPGFLPWGLLAKWEMFQSLGVMRWARPDTHPAADAKPAPRDTDSLRKTGSGSKGWLPLREPAL